MKDQYAIIKTESIHHEGDERSRTNPGHGYPAHTTTHDQITVFTEKDGWEAAINRLANPRYGAPEKFRAIIFQEVEVIKEVKITIK